MKYCWYSDLMFQTNISSLCLVASRRKDITINSVTAEYNSCTSFEIFWKNNTLIKNRNPGTRWVDNSSHFHKWISSSTSFTVLWHINQSCYPYYSVGGTFKWEGGAAAFPPVLIIFIEKTSVESSKKEGLLFLVGCP